MCSNNKGLRSRMLYTKFHRNLPSGPWLKIFKKVSTVYGHGSHLGHVTCKIMVNSINL